MANDAGVASMTDDHSESLIDVDKCSFLHCVTLLLVPIACVTTIAINLLLLHVFTQRRSLRTTSNRFVVNLLVINVCSSVTLCPFVVLHAERESAISSMDGGQMALSLAGEFALNYACTSSILAVLLIGVDQYVGVLHALRAHAHMTRARCVLLIGVTHVTSAVSATVRTLLLAAANFQPSRIDGVMHMYGVVYLATVIAAPFFIICIIYVLIYRAAHQNSARLRRCCHLVAGQSTKHQLQYHEILIDDDVDRRQQMAPQESSKPAAILTSLRTKLSNASAFRYREENRTAKISVMVIVMVLVCYAPYGIVLTSFVDVIPYAKRAAILLVIVANLCSPVLFALRNRRVRREIAKLAKCDRRTRDGATQQRRPRIVVQHASDAAPSTDGKRNLCTQNWIAYKQQCSFIDVPDAPSMEARGSFSSVSTQISNEE